MSSGRLCLCQTRVDIFWSARWFSRDFSFTARTILWGSRIEICFVSCFPSFQIALTSSVK